MVKGITKQAVLVRSPDPELFEQAIFIVRCEVRDGGEVVLKGVSMTARKNEIVGIVGESGCGKSTLLKLLLRFWERSGGQIRYNGTDIDEINTESLY